ncbi:MAG: alpha/beta hydrolase [Acidimicrobiales bacterium]|jgi:pimeloyl-ACP methyl ester carboxylesterase
MVLGRPNGSRSPRDVIRPAVAPAVAVLMATMVLLSGCTDAGHAGSPSATTVNPAVRLTPTTTSTTVPPLPVSPVDWTACGSLQCGSVTVPLDYRNPGGPTIQIAVARHPAEVPSERIGSLVINPGGPGASGIDDLPNELSVLTPEVLDRFDIVSFDPRGVGRSSPVLCTGGVAGGSSGPAIDPVPTTPAAQQALLRNDREFAAQCQHYSGSVLPYVGTVDAAQDLDRIRAALGDTQLTFVGHSYGTLLGATYAEMFPTHVRAMVLDGAIDPALSTVQYATDQADSLESELQSFFAWCASDPGCPWRPSGDPTTALLALIQQSRTAPLSGPGGATAGPAELYDALLAGLESQSSWPTLAGALAQAEQGSGAEAASMSGRYETGGSSNGAEAEQAIDCLDHPVDRSPSSYAALAASAGASAPVFGPLLTWGLLGCATWPVLPTRVPAPATDPGAPPILVVGTTGDPVTPYAWAVALAHELTGGVLLTWQGKSHVATFYSPCVRAAIGAYVVAGTLPAPGTVCTD